MESVAYLALILVLCYGLVKSADLVEDAFVHIARRLHINAFLIGFVVLSFASSLPEISVAISSSVSQVPQLSIGNLLGATLVLLTLVIGLNSFIHDRIKFTGYFGYPQVLASLALLALQVVVVLDRQLTLIEGVGLIAAYIAFVIYLSADSEKHHRLIKHAAVNANALGMLLLKATIGAVGLLLCSKWIVDAALVLAKDLQVNEAMIGLLILAVGTNLPEITILFRSRGKEGDTERLAIGNFIGSACVNTGIIGMVAVLRPHELTNFYTFLPVMVLLSLGIFMFAIFAWTGKDISWKEGLLLVAVYAALVVSELIIGH